MKQLNCWVSDELAAEVEQVASEDDRSISSWLRRLILKALDEAKEKEAA